MNIPSIDELLSKKTYDIYTDGSANLNVSAGYGYVIVHNNEVIHTFFGTVDKHFTAPHAELIAIIEALGYITSKGFPNVNFYSDSEYCVKTINIWGPSRKDWSKSAHADKFIPLLEYINNYHKISSLTFTHIPGHSGNKFNELADSLAKRGNVKK